MAGDRPPLRVIDGGGEPAGHKPVALYMVAVIAFGWFAAVGLVWTAYFICRVMGVTA